jgi:mandelamide amidase
MTETDLTATEALALMESGDLTAEIYAEALLMRADGAADLNAFIAIDADQVLAAARSADNKRRAGNKLSPLLGLPLALKDNIDTIDYPTTGGTPALKDHRPGRNAPVVQSLVDAGAIVFAKANLHELAFGVTSNNAAHGPARNPYDPARIAGGSSGGTGAALAARLVPAGLGTDTGGSVRIPASLCGVSGLRPSMGRYAQAGVIPISSTRDTIGPMARSIADLALLDGVITGAPLTVEPIDLKGLRIGVPREHYYENIDDGTAAVMEDALQRLGDYGVELIEADIASIGPVHIAADQVIVMREAILDLQRYLDEFDGSPTPREIVAAVASPDVKAILDELIAGNVPNAEAYRHATETLLPQVQAMYRDYFSENNIVAAVFPTTPLPATVIGEDTVKLAGKDVAAFNTFFRNTSPASIAGTPGVTLPVGLTPSGLPVGMEFDGPQNSDRNILALALAVEANEPAFPAPQWD